MVVGLNWFLEVLKEAIGTLESLVVVSYRQKGLEEVQYIYIYIYPQLEYRKCIRHLYKNFQTRFLGDWFKIKV